MYYLNTHYFCVVELITILIERVTFERSAAKQKYGISHAFSGFYLSIVMLQRFIISANNTYNNYNNITAFSTPHTNVPRRLQNSTECKYVHAKNNNKSRKELVEKVSLNAFFENINGRRLSDIVWKQIP